MQDDMDKIKKEMRDSYSNEAIPAAPVYTLAACVEAAEAHRRDADYEYTVPNLDEVKVRFLTCLCLCNEQEFAFLDMVASISEGKTAWESETYYYPYRVFAYNDFMYLFLHEDAFYLVLPDELLTIYRKVCADEEFAAIHAQNLELSEYAFALNNLYGAFGIDQFVEVWNQHHKIKLTFYAAAEFLRDRVDFHAEFEVFDGVVFNVFFNDSEEREAIWSLVEEMPYFMPSKSIIRKYAQNSYADFDAQSKQALDALFAPHITNPNRLSDLMWELTFSCEQFYSPSEVQTMLENAGLPIDDVDFRQKFTRLYNSLRDKTPVWKLRGFTPYGFYTETGVRMPPFAFPDGETESV